MKELRWSKEKNQELKQKRNITFEQLTNSTFIGIEEHPKRPNQYLMLFEFKGYIWVVPFVVDADHFFLKTAFPDRKLTKKYLGGK